MDKIPKPVKPFNHSKDLRIKFLNEWKKLFEAIHPNVEVFHCYDNEFSNFLNNSKNFDNVYFGDLVNKDTKILIFLPGELQLSYIVGLSGNLMFSKREVLRDSFYWETEDIYNCEPELFSWEKIYLDLCEISEEVKKEIPEPIKNTKSVKTDGEKYQIDEHRVIS